MNEVKFPTGSVLLVKLVVMTVPKLLETIHKQHKEQRLTMITASTQNICEFYNIFWNS